MFIFQVGMQKEKITPGTVPVKTGYMVGYEVVDVKTKNFEAALIRLNKLIIELEKQFGGNDTKEYFRFLKDYFKMFKDRYSEEKKNPQNFEGGRGFIEFSKDGSKATILLKEMMNRYGNNAPNAHEFLVKRLQEAVDVSRY